MVPPLITKQQVAAKEGKAQEYGALIQFKKAEVCQHAIYYLKYNLRARHKSFHKCCNLLLTSQCSIYRIKILAALVRGEGGMLKLSVHKHKQEFD